MSIKALKYLLFIVVFTISAFALESIESLMASGQALLERGAYSQAVTVFKKVVSRESDNFEAQFNLAFAYLQWGRNNNAVEEFKKTLQWQPKNSQAWANLAIAYENLNKKEEALYCLHQAVTFDPRNITARMNLAVIFVNANHSSQAIEQYKKVLEIDGSNEDALVNLSNCLINEKQYDEAIKYLKKVLIVNPNNGDAHYELGNIYWKLQNDIVKALPEYKLAVTFKPQNLPFYENYVAALVESGEKAQAVEVLKKSLMYEDDVFRKDKIQTQINVLEGNDNHAAKVEDDNGAKFKSKDQISELKKELRKEPSTTETKRLETKPVNVLADLQDISTDTSSAIDLKGEAKKRATNK